MRKVKKEKATAKIADLSGFHENSEDQSLTTNQGLRINDDQNSLKAGERGPTLLEDFTSARKSLILITNESLNGSCTPAARRHMGTFKCTNHGPIYQG